LTLILIVGLYPSPMVNMIQPPAARLASLIGGG